MSDGLDETVRAVLTRAKKNALSRDDFFAAIKNPIATKLSPWELWPLIGFLRHERRQKWAGSVVESKLKAVGRELATSGAFAHPEEADQERKVPDLPEWHYYFHGSGCCLRHEDGTLLDVDFAQDGSALEIDPYFYMRFLQTAPNLDWTDTRLRHSPPLENAWHFDLRRLVELRLIEQKWRFRLTDEGRHLAEQLEPLADEINRIAREPVSPTRVIASWLLVRLGDVPAAVDMLGDNFREVAATLKPTVAQTIQERLERVRASIRSRDENERKLALAALATIGRKHVEPEIWHALEQSPPCSVHLLCLRLVESWRDPLCEPKLVAVLERFVPAANFVTRWLGKPIAEKDEIERPRNGLLVAAAKTVFSYHTPHTISARTRQALQRAVGGERKACDAEAGFLLYLLSPYEGLAKLKTNLHNRVPITRSEAAIFLGMIGTDSAINALIETAEGPANDGGHEAACVLSMLSDERAANAAAKWNRRNDGYEEAEAHEVSLGGRTIKTWKMDDVLRVSMRNDIQHWSERVKQQYEPIMTRWSQKP